MVDLPRPRFPLGRIVATPGALAALAAAGEAPSKYLSRHVSGDWGDVCSEDAKTNVDALRDGDRILSAYTLPDGVRIWVITESSRTTTTLLLPNEY